ncbi:MAG: radical SAM family heme chaperone HemW [Tissierellia bacterium]|nr:radical SAM family heme chaperone HemW [Tissierellia bacterium]
MKNRLGIYLHIPFCRRRCGYCDFLTMVPREEGIMDHYLELLLRELSHYGEFLRGLPPETEFTVYLGGGTPSLLGTERLLKLFEGIGNGLPRAPLEWSMEANPESFLTLDGALLRRAGLNRLSLGVQSGSPRLLKVIGRIHTVDDASRAYEKARREGFTNINVDFISALPGERPQDREASLEWMEAHPVEHISVYDYILEEGSAFYDQIRRGLLPEPAEDDESLILYQEALVELGYEQYEISNFSREGRQCLHNLIYWLGDPYLGLGLGATGTLGAMRYRNPVTLADYEAAIKRGAPHGWEEELSPEDRTHEEIFLGLRMNEGIALSRVFPDGRSLKDFSQIIKRQHKLGHVLLEDGRMKLTAKGRRFANQVELAFME